MEVPHEFLDTWSEYMYLGAIVFISIGVLILVYHEIRVLAIRDLKEKYDYVNLNEVKFFWVAVVAFVIATFLFLNTLASDWIHRSGMRWFYVRLFISSVFLVLGYYLFYSTIRIYYPRIVDKRLNKLRNKPRISPDGNTMRKLSEEEEDAHMEPSMIEEELFHSIDYDVWLDEKTGFKKIEKYFAYQHADECPSCGYYTFKIVHEELQKVPTETEGGLFIRHYKCEFCGHRERREQTLAPMIKNPVA